MYENSKANVYVYIKQQAIWIGIAVGGKIMVIKGEDVEKYPRNSCKTRRVCKEQYQNCSRSAEQLWAFKGLLEMLGEVKSCH
jgi:lipid-binding SYLF domain-containing protein